MALDSLQDSDLEITDLPAHSMEKLQAMAPFWLHVGNPVDFWPIMMGHANRGLAMKEVMDMLLSDDKLGGIIYQQLAFTPQSGERLRMLLSYLASEHPDKPLIAGISGPASLQCQKYRAMVSWLPIRARKGPPEHLNISGSTPD
ncbi:MAG: hypothetical protein JXA01_05615 [Dehalococcoidia bacterium]|nr:hypothetical protein [Dehalococcoidia bacterium]